MLYRQNIVHHRHCLNNLEHSHLLRSRHRSVERQDDGARVAAANGEEP